MICRYDERPIDAPIEHVRSTYDHNARRDEQPAVEVTIVIRLMADQADRLRVMVEAWIREQSSPDDLELP